VEAPGGKVLQAGSARAEPCVRSWRGRVASIGFALGACLGGASACDGLLGDVEIERAPLSADPGTAELPVATGDAALAAACEPQSRRCVDGRLERCNEERTGWDVVDQCATSELCELTRETGNPICESPRCEPEERRCRAETLTVCNAGLTGYDDERACEAAVFCDPESGSCLTRSCEAGERRCNGAQIEACNRDGDAFEPIDAPPCGSAALCTRTGDGDVSCRNPVCAAGDFRCVGDSLLQRCSAGRDAWEDVRTCAALELCDETPGAAGCRPAECQDGERRCSNDALQECRASRDGFDVIANCGAAGCDSARGECRDPCVVGQRRCAGASVEACADPLTGWRVVSTCSTTSVCDVTAASGCREAACPINARRCRGASLERCNAQRTGFELVEVCATEALCVPNGNNNARCDAPECDAGERECRGRTLAICNSGRTGFDEVACGLLGCNDNANPPNCRGL
jgi:hypothetical protein